MQRLLVANRNIALHLYKILPEPKRRDMLLCFGQKARLLRIRSAPSAVWLPTVKTKQPCGLT